MTIEEAAKRVTRAADVLHRAFYPGEEVRLLADAEDALGPGIGAGDPDTGSRLVRKALDVIERELPPWMIEDDHSLTTARADAERDLIAVAEYRLQPAE